MLRILPPQISLFSKQVLGLNKCCCDDDWPNDNYPNDNWSNNDWPNDNWPNDN
jgi:hypothetical protein